jgi:thiosulfate reductase cytochrome b subunit
LERWLHSGTEWLKFTKKEVPTHRLYTAREDEMDVTPWIALPGHKNIGLGRHWHGVSNTFWLINGAIYIALLFGTGEWRRLIPTSWDIFPRAWDSLTTYLSLNIPPLSEFQPYDALQQLAYAFVVFILGPFMLITGAALSPAIAASAPWYIKMLGGRQAARSLHFIGLVLFAGFTVMHIFLVLVVHPRENVSHIVLGDEGPERFGSQPPSGSWACSWSSRSTCGPRGTRCGTGAAYRSRSIALKHRFASSRCTTSLPVSAIRSPTSLRTTG